MNTHGHEGHVQKAIKARQRDEKKKQAQEKASGPC